MRKKVDNELTCLISHIHIRPIPEYHSHAAIQEAIDYIAWKQGFYRDVLSGKIPYKSDLLPSDDSDGTDEK